MHHNHHKENDKQNILRQEYVYNYTLFKLQFIPFKFGKIRI